MTEVLTLVSLNADVTQLAKQAPGGVGGVTNRSGAGWSIAEREIGTSAELVSWLEQQGAAHGIDWAITPERNRRKRLLISDMDSTIIGQECLDELADFAGLKAEVSAITERAMRGELDFAGALTQRVAMLKGLGLEALAKCHAERVTLKPRRARAGRYDEGAWRAVCAGVRRVPLFHVARRRDGGVRSRSRQYADRRRVEADGRSRSADPGTRGEAGCSAGRDGGVGRHGG